MSSLERINDDNDELLNMLMACWGMVTAVLERLETQSRCLATLLHLGQFL